MLISGLKGLMRASAALPERRARVREDSIPRRLL